MSRTSTRRSLAAMLAAFASAVLVAITFMAATATPAQAQDQEVQGVYMILTNDSGGWMPTYGKPGEKLILTAKVVHTDRDQTTARNITYKWTYNKQLKATAKKNKLIINKLPRVGTYKFTVTGYDKSGAKLCSLTQKIIVRKSQKISVLVTKANNLKKKLSKLKKNQSFIMQIKNGSFGWSNNKKKPFYVWTVKNLKTGKTTTYSPKKSTFDKSGFITGSSIAGGSNPMLYAQFTKAGKYKITATIYHSDKVLAKAYKTITVS